MFWGYIRTAIFYAFYRSTTAPQPMTQQQTITYLWLGQALLLLAMLQTESEITAMIRTGAVASEIVRPLDLYSFWFARCFSSRAAPLLMRCIPIFILASLFFGLGPPASAAAGINFILATFLGLLLASSIVTLLTISLLWTISGEGVSRLASPLMFLFSGLIIPLPLLPDWVQPAIAALPFRGLVDTSFRIYTGHLAGPHVAFALLHQLVWLAFFIALGRFLLNRAIRRIVIQGG